MAQDAQATADSKPSRRKRLRASTWAVLLAAIAVLLLVEVPGRRTGLTTYAHGWPFVYLTRDYREYPAEFAAGTSLFSPGVKFSDLFEEMAPQWQREGLAWELESNMTPWSVVGTTSVSAVVCVVDVALAVVILLVVVWLFQRRNPSTRRLLQFRLGSLLIGVAVIAGVLAVIRSWALDLRADEETATALGQEIGHTLVQLNSYYTADRGLILGYGWDPPVWLPESLAKIGLWSDVFRRVHVVKMLGDSANIGDVQLEHATKLHYVRSLELSCVGVTGNGLSYLDRFPQLTTLKLYAAALPDGAISKISTCRRLQELDINGLRLNDTILQEISNLPVLEDLTVVGPTPDPADNASNKLNDNRWIHKSGITSLEGLSHLRSLVLSHQQLSDDAIEAIQVLQGVESLRLDRLPKNKLRLHDFPNLKQLSLESRPHAVSAELRDLPKLEVLVVSGAIDEPNQHRLTLESIPHLKTFWIAGAELDKNSWARVLDSEHLERLQTDTLPVDEDGNAHLQRSPFVREIEIVSSNTDALRLSDMLSLKKLRVSHNKSVKELHLKALPSLTDLDLEDNLQLKEIKLSDLEHLRYIQIQDSNPSDIPQTIAISGLSRLVRLESFDSECLFTKETINDLRKVATLKSLTLNARKLGDDELAALRGLTQLEALDLSQTSLTDDGLSIVRDMARLRRLYIVDTHVTAEGVERLRKQFPNLFVCGRPR